MKILFEYWHISEEEIKKNLYFVAQACESDNVSIFQILGHIDKIINTWKRYKTDSRLLSTLLESCASRHEENYIGHHTIWETEFSAKQFFVSINKKQIQHQILLRIP